MYVVLFAFYHRVKKVITKNGSLFHTSPDSLKRLQLSNALAISSVILELFPLLCGLITFKFMLISAID